MKRRAPKQQKWKDESEDSDNIYDEVDRFHMEQDQLSDSYQIPAGRRREELLNVEGDISGEEDEIFSSGSDESGFQSSEEEEENIDEVLPSANKWSKKKSQFYDTSYVDEDWGGMNENEAEFAELEEQDAIMRQKKLDATFAFLRRENKKTAVDDVSMFNEDVQQHATEKDELDEFDGMNPEFCKMVEEYREKRKVFCDKLFLLKAAVETNETGKRTVLEELILLAYRIFARYLLNILFYFRMKLTTGLKSGGSKRYLEDHPVIDAIISQKKMVMRVDEFLVKNEKFLDRILSLHAAGSSLASLFETSGFVDAWFENRKKSSGPEESEVVKDLEAVEQQEASSNAGKDDYFENEASDSKRAITSEIQTNKGLTTKRKKGTQHSRVKKRKQYEKALIKKRSQRPDLRRELKPYGGEQRGIRVSAVKSIKLKS